MPLMLFQTRDLVKKEGTHIHGIALYIVVCIHTGHRDTIGCDLFTKYQVKRTADVNCSEESTNFLKLACAIPKNRDTWMFQQCIVWFYVIKNCKYELNSWLRRLRNRMWIHLSCDKKHKLPVLMLWKLSAKVGVKFPRHFLSQHKVDLSAVNT